MTQPDTSVSERMGAQSAVHATAVAIGEAGVLIRGRSGSGKSELALAVIAEAERKGLFARLISDDRVRLSAASGRLLAHAHPAIAGRIEQRGEGILAMAHEACVVVRAVVDLVDRARRPARLPEGSDKTTDVGGVSLPRLSLLQGRPAGEAARRILAFLENT